MRLYLEVARRSYRRFATYRAATAAGVFANTVWGFIKAYIFMALWTSRGEIGGYDIVDAVTFAFLSQALSAPLSMFGLSTDLPERIKSGAVTTDLPRPAQIGDHFRPAGRQRLVARTVGHRTGEVAVRLAVAPVRRIHAYEPPWPGTSPRAPRPRRC